MRKNQKTALTVVGSASVVLLICSFGLKLRSIESIAVSLLAGGAVAAVVLPNNRRALDRSREKVATLRKLGERNTNAKSRLEPIVRITSEIIEALQVDPKKLVLASSLDLYLAQIVPPIERYVSLNSSKSELALQSLREFESEALPMISQQLQEWSDRIYQDDRTELLVAASLIEFMANKTIGV
ncbi:hypothetical protein BH10CYA1_BH10CYA1_53810 [soil metagenome]